MLQKTTPMTQKIFTFELDRQITNGWHIEAGNQFGAVLSKKKSINWMPHLLMVAYGFLVYLPLALFWLVLMMFITIVQSSKMKRVWVDPNGEIFESWI